MREIVLSIGSNQAGDWGEPRQTMECCLRRLADAGLVPSAVSPLFETVPVGGSSRRTYLNAVVCVRSNQAPAQVLRTVKALERQAGRRPGHRWGPRPLDIDIIDDGGRILGWRLRPRPAGREPPAAPPVPQGLVLPHPRMHQRAFVLEPLTAVHPFWIHPVLHRPVSHLLLATGAQRKGVRISRQGWDWTGRDRGPGWADSRESRCE